MYIKFNASPATTVGLELEVQTINPRTGELMAGAYSILSELAGQVLFKPELFSSTIEINTPVCSNLTELKEALEHNLQVVQDVAQKSGLEILISGCHPFANWQQQQITQQERYLNLLHRIQWPVRQFLIFGLHVHVGITDPDTAIYVMNRFLPYLPHLIALSASSPFWNGFDTGLATTRIKIFEELPNAGIPYYIEGWENYSKLVEKLIRTNSIDTVRDIWWDVRPHPIFGTVEVRVCDAMPTMKENMALTTMIYLLVEKFIREKTLPDQEKFFPARWILEENKWRAARYGIYGQIIVNENGETRLLKEEIQQLFEDLTQFAERIDQKEAADFLSPIPEILQKGPSYLRQRNWIQKRPGDYKFIIDNMLKETKEDRILNGS